MIELCPKDRQWVDSVWEKLDTKLYEVSRLAYDKIPYTTINGVYNNEAETAIFKWTNGFWPGLMWLMYVGTGREQYRRTAEHAEEMLDEVLRMPWYLNHDVGFMWHISSGVNYRLFGGYDSKARTLHAANHLAARFNLHGSFIRAWNAVDKAGISIIDCMMNLPLLYWAAEEVQDKRYYFIAEEHADHTLREHLRPDGSVRHIVKHDSETGEVIGYAAGQGYSEESAWSRGQGWAIYGFTLSYIYTGKKEYLDAAKRAAHYFIANITDEYIPRVDFRAPGKEHDTTAGAIAACGLIEIAKLVDELEKDVYLNAAIRILRALEEKYCDWTMEEQSVLQHGVEKYYPDEVRKGKPIIYGDYYFAEAIYKLKGFDMLFW